MLGLQHESIAWRLARVARPHVAVQCQRPDTYIRNDSTRTIHITMLMEPRPADEDTLITTVQQHALEPRHFHLHHIQRRTPWVHVTIAFNDDHRALQWQCKTTFKFWCAAGSTCASQTAVLLSLLLLLLVIRQDFESHPW
jgi:hypothetical protein